MTRHAKSEEESLGQDSFLDVVSNLVGILIILVMAVGTSAKDAMLHAEMTRDREESVDIQPADVAAAKVAEHNVEADIHRISEQIQQQNVDLRYREQERDRVQLFVQAAEQSLAQKREKLDESQRAEFDRRNELAGANAELGTLHGEIEFLSTSKPQTAIIEHLPTPMAKTVFGKELHLRLRQGRITVIPWDDFLQLLKADAPKKTWRLKDQDEFTELVGPLGGFWMRYTLKRQSQMTTTKVGIATQQTIVLDRFTLVPESEEMGERLEAALQSGSQFTNALSSYRPDSTTVTAWVYPDSFNEFRELKRELFRRGYVTAARPLPADHPIGGSPDGIRSAAQ